MILAVEWYFGALLALLWIAIWLLLAAVVLGITVHAALSSDSFVQMLEARYGAPGTTRVLPECGCTVRYLGTTVRGRDYDVHVRRLD
jgi:hypothetical protein